QENLNVEGLNTLFHHDRLMLSYNPKKDTYLGNSIGYVDESLSIKVNKKVSFPTWQMSSTVGMIHASVVVEVDDKIPFNSNFDYYLNSLAKLLMPEGLFCYSEPKLLNGIEVNDLKERSIYTLFRFVKQHYRTRWVFLLFFNFIIYEKKWAFLPFVSAFFYSKRNADSIAIDTIKVASSRKVIASKTIDVIIPTIGRKDYLYDVLQDLAKQSLLPKKVIVVEQNPLQDSISELDYLTNENWPFQIKHIFTRQAGACNARNLALKEVEHEWVFLADDDIVFNANFFENAFYSIEQYGSEAASFCCLQKGEKTQLNTYMQWGAFGSGCSMIAAKSSMQCRFDTGYEFGYGEDNDFGMQLRNLGHDVLYFPQPEILHLKAPIGGFRTKPLLSWSNDEIQPKPSPTVMLFQIAHKTKEQNLGYKTILFLKYYRQQSIRNPFKYYFAFEQQWNRSLYWANKLDKKR
ncbi:glycosyltransferase, partial [Flavobacterium sp.]|uniref:glycosyltransferase family 2 protein n=1 Tax=Flavobacterium sp. TaxID=239 RepID=UPI002638E3D4